MSKLEAASDSGSLKTSSCSFQEVAALPRPNGESFSGGYFGSNMDLVPRTNVNETFSNSTGQQYYSATLPTAACQGTRGERDFQGREQFLQQNYGSISERFGAVSQLMGTAGYFSSVLPHPVEASGEPTRFSQLTPPSTWSGMKPNFGSGAEVPANVSNALGVSQWSAPPGRLPEEIPPTFSFDSSDPSGRDKLIYDLERVNHWLRSELELARKEIDRLRLQLAEHEKGKNKQENSKTQSRYWTPSEHQRFLEALRKFGHKDVKSISNYVGTRNPTQVRTHAQKYFLRLFKESRNRQEQGMGRGFSASRRSMSEPDLNRAELQNSSTTQMYCQDNEMSREQKENDDSYASNLGSSCQAAEPKNGIRLLSLVATNETNSHDKPGEDRMNIQENTS
ncbi:Myb-like protein I [Galdieria sulphuraria]|uniref:Myb domain-containing protein n=1 Tax=Galdieria sulphuraria TaxID=130081 RepID=M2X392_GALSU|nr:myb domain-containing protein [Galdieria sulphuraria]EME30845.1 myb domain-containing protein [Galdieria sulphuraria]GJD08213.1 Myb-like protein I [Galdieria sulphuraria]|eukprot:XP_005707365.1 myb domain-containing protein [Galdieria sulphuraria]